MRAGSTNMNNVSGPESYEHDENRYEALIVDEDIEVNELWCFPATPNAVDPRRTSVGVVG